MSAYIKTLKHSLQNKFKIWNIDEKKYQKMEVRKFLYFALVNFKLVLFTPGPSILFHDQFTDSLHYCLHPVLVKCKVSLDWVLSEAFRCYRRKLENGENKWRHNILVTSPLSLFLALLIFLQLDAHMSWSPAGVWHCWKIDRNRTKHQMK